MVDSARQLLDELMGRNRNLDPKAKCKQLNWEDGDFCQYYLVKFCPHDLFVNTRADLGQCPKLHDDEAKRLFEEARPGIRKRQYEDEFLRFCNNMINEVDRKIQKGKMRLLLMNKTEQSPGLPYVTKQQEQINVLDGRIKKLVGEAEEAGHRGDVEQAQGLMSLCDELKEEKEQLTKSFESSHWSMELAQAQEKQMEVCEVCGAFLIVGDAQQRIEDHLTGKQHLGYSRLRKAVDETYEHRRKDREDEEGPAPNKRRDEESKKNNKTENGHNEQRQKRGGDDRNRKHRDEHDDRRQNNRDRNQRTRDFDRRDNNKDRNRDFSRRSDRGADRGNDRDRNRHRGDKESSAHRSRSRSEHQ